MSLDSPSPQPAAPSIKLPDDQELVIDAVIEDGLIRPLTPLDLPEGASIQLRIARRLVAVVQATGEQRDRAAPGLRGWFAERLTLTPWDRVALTTGGLVLAGIGQYSFSSARAFSWGALCFVLGGIALFVTALSGIARFAAGPPAPEILPPQQISAARLALLFAAAILIGLLLFLLQINPPLPNYNWALALWGAAITLSVAAFWPLTPPSPPRPAQERRNTLMAAAAVAVIVLGAFVLRAWNLEEIPATLGGDEGSQGLEAVRVLSGDLRNPFSTGWLGVPTLSFYFNASTIALFGNTATGLRLPWALIGTLTVLTTYALVARLQGRALALMTAALLAGYHYHIHYSRLGSNQVADALFVALALLLLYRGYDRRSLRDWALCGVVVGVAQYFYAGARFTAIVVAAVIGLLILRDRVRFWHEQRLGVAALLVTALVAAGPMIQYALRFPNDYNARVNEVGIFQSGWLEREQGIRNESAPLILLDQLKRAALAFNAYPDRTTWYGSPDPLFGLLDGALFILGFGYALLHLFDRRLFPMSAWWLGAMLLGGVLTESPPSSQRLITMAVPAVFFVALAITHLARLVGQTLDRVRIAPLLAGATTLVIILLSVRWYFVEYTPSRVYGNFNALVATEMATYMRKNVGTRAPVFFFGPPRMYIGFGTIPYLAPEVRGFNVDEPLTAPFDASVVAPGSEAVFIFLPERAGELEWVRASLPWGQLDRIPSPLADEPLFLVYQARRAVGAQQHGQMPVLLRPYSPATTNVPARGSAIRAEPRATAEAPAARKARASAGPAIPPPPIRGREVAAASAATAASARGRWAGPQSQPST